MQAAEAEGLSNRLRALGHAHEANRVYRAGKDLVLVAKTFLGTSETFNLFFHKGDPEALPPPEVVPTTRFEQINPRAEVSDSSATVPDGAGVAMPWIKNV